MENNMQGQNIAELPITSVFPNPDQPRKDFNPEKLEELAMSIKEYGVLEPIVVTPRESFEGITIEPSPLVREGRGEGEPSPIYETNQWFMIIAGERRYRASLLAERDAILARIIEADDALVEELALLENIQREDLNIIEEAKAYKGLLERGWTKEELAKKMGFKQTWRIDERLSLLNLAAEYQDMVIKGKIGNSQAFEMSRVSQSKQIIILKKIQSGELGTYNKLRAFVDGLIALEKQESFFELTSISEEEKKSIDSFDIVVKTIERFIGRLHQEGGIKHLSKAAIHSNIRAERIDLVIQNLQKIRKHLLEGEGIQNALKEVSQ